MTEREREGRGGEGRGGRERGRNISPREAKAVNGVEAELLIHHGLQVTELQPTVSWTTDHT